MVGASGRYTTETMGIIDETSAKLTCPKCGAMDTIRASQKGSVYAVGRWGDFSEATNFDVETKRGVDGPEVTSAKCKTCKVAADVG